MTYDRIGIDCIDTVCIYIVWRYHRDTTTTTHTIDLDGRLLRGYDEIGQNAVLVHYLLDELAGGRSGQLDGHRLRPVIAHYFNGSRTDNLFDFVAQLELEQVAHVYVNKYGGG